MANEPVGLNVPVPEGADQPPEISNNSEPNQPPTTKPLNDSTTTNQTEMNQADQYSTEPKKSKSKKKWGVFFGGCIFIVLIFGAFLALAGLVSYGKVTLPDAKLQEQIEFGVQNLPFMPKTPKYMLFKSAEVHSEISSANVDISASVETDTSDITEILGYNSFDLQVTGPVNFNDPENPEVSLNAKITNQLDFDYIFKDETNYFKVNEIPELIFSFLGVTPEQLEGNPIVDRWVAYDMTALDTDARDALDEKRENEEEEISDITEEKILKLLNEELVDMMEISEDTLDGNKTTRITITFTNDDINRLSTELNDIFNMGDDYNSFANNEYSKIDNLEISMWIDDKDYYMRKATVTGTIVYTYGSFGAASYPGVLGAKDYLALMTPPEEDMPDTGQEYGRPDVNDLPRTNEEVEYEVNFAFAVNLSDFGGTFDIQAPNDAVEAETYIAEVSNYFQELMMSQYEDMYGDTELYGEDYSGFSGGSELDNPTGFDSEDADGFAVPQEVETFEYDRTGRLQAL